MKTITQLDRSDLDYMIMVGKVVLDNCPCQDPKEKIQLGVLVDLCLRAIQHLEDVVPPQPHLRIQKPVLKAPRHAWVYWIGKMIFDTDENRKLTRTIDRIIVLDDDSLVVRVQIGPGQFINVEVPAPLPEEVRPR
jgi:hypothetical protein